MKRRNFLLLTGAAGAAATLEPLISKLLPAHDDAAIPEVMPGIESFVMTTCLMCPGSCGIKVRRRDGDPTGIAGNPNHPVNMGGVCTEGIAALQLLYRPDRLVRPLKRTGPRGSDKFEPVGWDEALDSVAGTLRKLTEKNGRAKAAFVLGRKGGSMEDLVCHFMNTLGSPNVLRDYARDGYLEVFHTMHGLSTHPAFDFDNTEYVLSFGVDLLNSWESPLQFQRSYAGFHTVGRSTKGNLAVADIRFTRTAAHAKDWVGVTPGSYGALALGVAYVMLRENLYDADFAEEHLYGFKDVDSGDGKTKLGYRSLVLRDYSPEVVSRLTGVPVEKVLALGKAFGESSSAIAIFDENVAAQPGGLYAAMAVHALNLLKGNLNKPGGIYLQPKVPLTPLVPDSPPAIVNDIAVEDLATLTAREGFDVAFLYYSNPFRSSTFYPKLRESLDTIGTVVSFSPFLDESCRHADWVLPDSLPLERWEDRRFPSSFPIAGWGIVQPCVEPAGESRHSGDVLLELTRRIGGSVAAAHPWKNFEELLKHRARGLYETRRGSLCTDPFDMGLVAQMESRGWWLSGNDNFDQFWKRLLEAGAWADPNYQVRSLRDYSGNHDGKIDLYCRDLEKRLTRPNAALSEIECMPHYHSEEGSPVMLEKMTLNPYRPGKQGSGTHDALPWTMLALTPTEKLAGDPWAEISQQDAHAYRIRNLDWITVESREGKIKVRALVSAGAAPGVINVPCGQGPGNPLQLLAPERDPLSGLPYRFGTKVKVYKA